MPVELMRPESDLREKDTEELELEDLVFGGLREQVVNQAIAQAGQSNALGYSIDESFVDDTPAWHEDDDEQVDIHTKKRLRKLKTEFDETSISTTQYEQRLRSQYQKLVPTPKWAELGPVQADGSSLLMKQGGIVKQPVLNPDKIDMLRVKDANQESYSKTLRLFQIDGKENPKLQSMVLKDLPIFNASFSMDGLQVIMTGRRNYFYVYNLENGSVERIHGIRGRKDDMFEKTYVSPCNKYLAVLGRDGYIILLSMLTKQWIADLKMTGEVSDVCFSSDGKYLFSIGVEGQVYKWDLESRECVHRFTDHGAVKPSKIAVSPNGEWLATGANTGVVNLYTMERCMASEAPEPEKAVMNIVSPISTLMFHPSSQLLAFGSNEMVDALRLLHVPTHRVVKNWPTSKTPLNFVWSVDFSKDGKFIAIGNAKGKALLYRFKAF